MRAAFGHTGGLRADHVMGLFRLWWVPAGMTPGQGAYVRYPHEAMVGVLTGEAAGPARWRSGRTLARSRTGSATTWPPRACSARPCCGSSAAGTACRCRPGGGATAAWPRSAPTTSRRWRRSSPASRSRCGPVSGCSPASRRPSRPPPPRPCGPGRMPSPGRGWPWRPPGRTRRSSPSRSTAISRAPRPRCWGSRWRTRSVSAARRTCPAPPRSTRTGASRWPTATGGRSCWRTCQPTRACAPCGRGQPAWRSRSWQRSARSRPSRPSMSSRRSAAGGLVVAIKSSVASITERLSATG